MPSQIAAAVARHRLAVARYIEAANRADAVWAAQREPPQVVSEADVAAYDAACDLEQAARCAVLAIVPASGAEIRELLSYALDIDRDGSDLRTAVASVLASPMLVKAPS